VVYGIRVDLRMIKLDISGDSCMCCAGRLLFFCVEAILDLAHSRTAADLGSHLTTRSLSMAHSPHSALQAIPCDVDRVSTIEYIHLPRLHDVMSQYAAAREARLAHKRLWCSQRAADQSTGHC